MLLRISHKTSVILEENLFFLKIPETKIVGISFFFNASKRFGQNSYFMKIASVGFTIVKPTTFFSNLKANNKQHLRVHNSFEFHIQKVRKK